MSAIRHEQVLHDGNLLAIILRAGFNEPGIHFFTDPSLSQQLAYMRHGEGKTIAPHVHNRVSHQVTMTQEVLLIRRGRLRVDFYSEEGQYLESRVLVQGDTILLASGGHGFEVLEELEMIEVKQGPYPGESGKRPIPPVPAAAVRVPGRS
jgi:mannose-6-phosphate isomerase-like protein (cupin superfamily)